MAVEYSVPLSDIIKTFSLTPICCSEETDKVLIRSAEINKPGLQLFGQYQYFDETRIEIIGLTEMQCIKEFDLEHREKALEEFFSRRPPAVIITRNLEPGEVMLQAAKRHNVPLLHSADGTSAFMAALISYLNVHLAPRVTRHGVLVEVYGEGILLLGESGVGKSETAIELIKRGHRLIADDAVEIRRVSSRSLVGSAPDNIRHYVELRGIGIINARRIFGMGSIKQTEKIDLVLNMELWNPERAYDRMGLENEYTEILGLQIPSITIPVKPGRNLAVIIEVAAMNNRQKKLGYNAAKELLAQLGRDQNDAEDLPLQDDWS